VGSKVLALLLHDNNDDGVICKPDSAAWALGQCCCAVDFSPDQALTSRLGSGDRRASISQELYMEINDHPSAWSVADRFKKRVRHLWCERGRKVA
jgi:hypothetical protein